LKTETVNFENHVIHTQSNIISIHIKQ